MPIASNHSHVSSQQAFYHKNCHWSASRVMRRLKPLLSQTYQIGSSPRGGEPSSYAQYRSAYFPPVTSDVPPSISLYHQFGYRRSIQSCSKDPHLRVSSRGSPTSMPDFCPYLRQWSPASSWLGKSSESSSYSRREPFCAASPWGIHQRSSAFARAFVWSLQGRNHSYSSNQIRFSVSLQHCQQIHKELRIFSSKFLIFIHIYCPCINKYQLWTWSNHPTSCHARSTWTLFFWGFRFLSRTSVLSQWLWAAGSLRCSSLSALQVQSSQYHTPSQVLLWK